MKMSDLESGMKKNNAAPQGQKKRTFVEAMSDGDIQWLERISNTVNTAEEQVPLIIKEIEAESSYYQAVVSFCKDLQNALNIFFKEQKVKVFPFGSAIMYLALKGSDVDVFLDFGGELPLPANEFTKALRKIMYKTKLVRKAFGILATVPIVKCETKKGMTCDLSFLNRLGVMNSKLIKYLLEIDERIRPLILILKFLLKKKELIPKGGMSSYILIILTVFFLQQLRILPSIKELQDLSTSKDIIEGWDTSFSTQITKSDLETQCDYSVLDLLTRFFKFYAEFEFAFYIICPFTAKAYLKPFFAESEYIPQEFCLYRENVTNKTHPPFELSKFMCVQDPFDHSRNISKGNTQPKVFKFQSICQQSLEICQEELQNKNKKDSNSKFFKKLFTRNVEIVGKRKVHNQRIITIHTDKFMTHTYIDPCSEDILRDNWSRTMTEKLIDILTRVLMCKVNKVPREKYNEKSMDLENLNMVAYLECEFEYFYLISKKRNEVKRTLELTEIAALTDREELISKRMRETFVKANDQKPYKFETACFVKKGPTCFCLNVESQDRKGIYKEVDEQFVKFLKFHLPKLINS